MPSVMPSAVRVVAVACAAAASLIASRRIPFGRPVVPDE